MAESILNLQTLTERATVCVDGVPYDLINPGELSVVDTFRVERLAANVARLEAARAEELKEEHVVEMTDLLQQLLRVIFLAPRDIQAKLSDGQRLQVLDAFIGLRREGTAPNAGARESGASVGGE